jgi:hypothetical protein
VGKKKANCTSAFHHREAFRTSVVGEEKGYYEKFGLISDF